MKQKRQLILFAAAALALLGLVLRFYVLTNCMDESRMLIPGSRGLAALVVYILLVVGTMTALCLGTNKVPGSERSFSRGSGWLFAALLMAVAVILGGGATLISEPELDKMGRYVCLGALVSGLCMAAAALLRGREQRGLFWICVIPAVFCLGKLIYDFKDWSFDPLVADFCLRLMTVICSALAVMLLSGFPLGYGEKRAAILWGLCAGIFALTTLPDYILRWNYSAPRLLTNLGFAGWAVVAALQLLRDEPQSALPPEKPEDPAAPEAGQ